MRRESVWMPGLFLAALGGAVLATPTAAAGDIGYVEDFALSGDRSTALKQLIPGTEDFYYFHCLNHLNRGELDKVPPLTKTWYERNGHNQTPRLTEIQTRYALLNYEKDPKGTLEYVRGRLNLRFDHQKEVVGLPPDLPTALDPKRIATATLTADSLGRWGNLQNFEDAALDRMAADPRGADHRRELLSRLTRPDQPNLPKLVVDDINYVPHRGSFGAYPIHARMTRAQLDELLKLQPDLLNNHQFVLAYLTKLQPGADDDWKRDRGLTRAYLDRLQAFADRLAPAHNSLKAHVLFHRLAFDRAEGRYDKAKFLAYLQLPRNQGYMAHAWTVREECRRWPADLNADYTAATLLPRVGADEALVRNYLEHFFATTESIKDFDTYVNDTYLTHVLAETKLATGAPDAERWAGMLPPGLLQQVKDRVDIDFAFTNRTEFGVGEAVKIELFVKNVPSLLVKVYEINTRHWYRTQGRELDTDVNLDGLVANSERVVPGNPDPFRRVPVALDFPDGKGTYPEKDRPGVYVIDFIGAGKSSRTLVRKGRLYPVVTTGTAGQVVRVVDETRKEVKDAHVWVGGHEYKAGKDGAIVVPFSTSPGRHPLVVGRGEFACLDALQHQPEHFQLTAGIYVDRESLLAQRVAPILVRPGLTLNGKPVSVKLLEDVRLRVTSVDLDGVPSSTEVPNFKLFEDRETIHEVRVPARLASLTVQLTAQVKALSTGKTVDLATGQAFGLNEIDRTDRVEDLHLARFGAEYVIELLGRTGEPKPDRAVNLSLKHREFKEPVSVQLKTDAEGRVHLGALADIATVTATNPEGTSHTWPLLADRHTYRQLVHARKGDPVALPYLGEAGKPSRDELALFEVVGGTFRTDRFDAIAVQNGRIVLNDLPPADYDLFLKRTGEKIRVRVADGVTFDGHQLNGVRHLQLPGLKPVSIESVTADGENLTVRLRDASKFARVHVFGTRYLPAFDPFAGFARVRDSELDGQVPPSAESLFLTGRNIGDEYRYVLERRTQKKFPGNMLERPGFLLNPWAVRTTETGEQAAQAGDHFQGRGGGVTGGGAMAPPAPKPDAGGWAGRGPGQGGGNFADLDFLYDAASVAVNLTADEAGVLKLPLKDLGPHALVHVVAVDPLNTTCRAVALPEKKALFTDLRLRNGLDPAKHFTQQKLVTVAEQGKPFTIEDAAGSRFEAYDSLAKVYALYATLSKDPKLAEFAFVLKWPTLKPEEKKDLYSRHACHELNFFLMKKDPAFFDTVVKPYTGNKRDKTFLDVWLTGADVAKFRNPWEHGRLNVVERVLLARRTPDELPKTARHLDDLFRLLPPATERDQFLFNAAVEGLALSTPDDASGLPKPTSGPVAYDPKAEAYRNAREAKPEPGVTLGFAAPAPPAAATPAPTGMPSAGAGGFGAAKGAMPARPGAGAPGRDGAVARKKADPAKDAPADRPEGDKAEKQVEELKKALDAEDLYFRDDRKERGEARRLFRKLDPTMEWAENNYYKLLIGQQTADLVSVTPFWTDYARHDGGSPFLTRHIPAASRNFTEMMFALSVLDLPFEPAKHDVKYEAGRMTLTPGGRVIAFHEEVRPADGPGRQVPILVSQNFFRHGDRYREENGERFDKYVTGEFVAHNVYGCQVVVTNPTSSRQKLSVLVQMPVGSIPLANGKSTKTVNVDLEPYRTHTADYLFYFPKAGTYAHFPVHVAKNEQFVAAPAPVTFNVVAKPTQLDTGSWDYVSQHGTHADVLGFLNRENVRALNLDKIAFRLKDREFFESVVRLLQERHLYHPTTYSYGVHHADVSSAKQFLLHQDGFVGECGGPIASPLLAIDPVARHTYEHLEYKPLVNARAHALGNRRQIVNDRFHEQYHRLLKTLTYRNSLTDADLLAVTYYLLLQDRIDEATETFARVGREKVPTKMQYDYCAAYLAMFAGKPHLARAVASEYLHHPVDRWRNTFAAVVAQVDEIEGKGGRLVDKDDPTQQQGNLAATEPALELAVAGNDVTLTFANLETVKLNYYLMDVELLFSTNPFVARSGGRFATIRPNGSGEVALPKGRTKHAVPLPAEFEGRNVLVEATAGGITRTVSHFATTMTVAMTENYGQVRVTDAAAGQALPKVYVKVYAKLADGSVKFHKDGYTDLRGRFDYVSVNTPERQAIERFSVLVLSEDRGAVIREAAPPAR